MAPVPAAVVLVPSAMVMPPAVAVTVTLPVPPVLTSELCNTRAAVTSTRALPAAAARSGAARDRPGDGERAPKCQIDRAGAGRADAERGAVGLADEHAAG